jgi:O-antigen/teichoic acid export membrane protein
VSLRIALKAAADAAGKAVTLVVMVMAARTLSTTAFGVLALATTVGWLLGVATDAGWSMHLAREVARHRDRWRGAFVQAMSARTAAAYGALALAALVSKQVVPGDDRVAFVLLVAAQLVSAVLETAAHLFRGLERSEIESVLHVAQRMLAGALAAGVLWAAPRLDYLGAALLAPPLLALIAAAVVAWRLDAGPQAVAPVPPLSWAYFQHRVLPLGAGVLLSALYFRCDLFFVERWHGLEAAGAYNAVFRLVDAVRLLPAAVMAVTFPVLCRATDLRPAGRLGAWMTAAGAALFGLTAVLSTWIVVAVYGEPYRHAGTTLAVLSAALPLFFLNYTLTHQVIGWDGQRAYLRIAGAALVANLTANLVLVPAYGGPGAAVATILTELVVTAGCLHAVRGGPALVAAPPAPAEAR